MASDASVLTLYEEIYNHIREGIQEGLFAPGMKVESESALMKRFGVSRVTVRSAISRLVHDGLVVRRQGKGTFVVSPRFEYHLFGELQGTAEILARQGVEPRMKVLSHAIVKPDPTVQAALELGADENVLRIERQDLAGDIPVAFAMIHLPEWLGGQLTPEDVAREQLYRLLWQKHSLFVDRAYQTFRAAKSDFKVATILSIPVGAPVIVAQRTNFSSDGRPVESANVFYRSEILFFSVNLKRSRPSEDLRQTTSLKAQLSMDALSRK